MNSQTAADRELVFCHECENEWYRDEYGLVCPECHSDFVQVVSSHSFYLRAYQLRTRFLRVRDENHDLNLDLPGLAPLQTRLRNVRNAILNLAADWQAVYGPRLDADEILAALRQGRRRPVNAEQVQAALQQPLTEYQIEEGADPRLPEIADQAELQPAWMGVPRSGHAHSHGQEEEDAARNAARANPNVHVHDLLSNMMQQIGGMTPHDAIARGRQRNPAGGEQGTMPPPPVFRETGSQGQQQRNSADREHAMGPPPVPRDTRPDAPLQGNNGDGSAAPATRSFRWGPFSVHTSTYYNTQTWVNGRPVQAGPPGNRTTDGQPASFNTPFGATRQVAYPHDPDMLGILNNLGNLVTSMQQTRPAQGHGGGQRIVFTVGGPANRPERAGMPPTAESGRAILAALGMLGDGAGDYAWNDVEFNRIVGELMNQNSSEGPEPASEEAIGALPRIKVTKDMTGEDSQTAECGICLSDCEVGEEVAELPCKHWFHFECVQHWLKQHDTCPSCRRGIMPQGTGQNRLRNTGETPRTWTMPFENLTRANTNERREGGDEPQTQQTFHAAAGVPGQQGPTLPPFSDSRSPQSEGADGREGGRSGSVFESIGNNILGWVGRHLSATAPAPGESTGTQTGGDTSQRTASFHASGTGPSTSSRRSSGGGSGIGGGGGGANRESRRRSRNQGDLDDPDVD